MKFSNNIDIFNELKRIQEKIEKAQKKLELKEFISKIGDIIIVMQGNKKVIDIQIKKKATLKNIDLIQESLLLSFNDVLKQVEEASKNLLMRASQEYDF